MIVVAGLTRSWKVSRETEKNNILGQEVEDQERCSISLLRSKFRAFFVLVMRELCTYMVQDGSGSLFCHLVLRQDSNHFAGL